MTRCDKTIDWVEVDELTEQDRKERKLPTVKVTLPPEHEGLEILRTVDIPLTATIINK